MLSSCSVVCFIEDMKWRYIFLHLDARQLSVFVPKSAEPRKGHEVVFFFCFFMGAPSQYLGAREPGLKLDQTWTRTGPEVGKKWTRTGLKPVKSWTRTGLKLN